MSKHSPFNEVKETIFPTLEQYVPIVARVHGKNHPEFHEVHQIFNAIIDKTKAAGIVNPDLNEEFIKLREISNNYTVPDDVCESYEAVYKMLAEVDEAYQAD
ncbi:iron-sulfur cluster repair di-iron protein, ric [Trichococcus alkaliphilus]|uniref:iron-sulfur cluster repair di-iron protein, ric n=1 Tax=Trichococcus alkaliphilus TaxID=2052943 RepID=UPI000D0BBC5F|nr:iron-sulfur cluster repair di-iron protein, ric [Trichococcus alkaliphilus]